MLATRFAVALVVALFAIAAPASASINVNTSEDAWVSDSKCSLREAVHAMNIQADFQGCTEVDFPKTWNHATISGLVATPQLTRTGTDDTGEFGDLDILRSGTSISGSPSAFVYWSDTTAGRDRVFDVNPGGDAGFTFSLTRVAVSGGLTTGDGGGVRMSGTGGTLSIEGVLSSSSTLGIFSGNKAARGGAVYAGNNTLTIDDTLFFDNEATGAGGGAVGGFGTQTITDSELRGNRATGLAGSGGALLVNGNATIRRSSFESNSAAAFGGAVAATLDGIASVEYSRLVGNTAGAVPARQEIARLDDGSFDVEHDWWGSNAGQPTTVTLPNASFDSTPLKLRLTGPASLNKNQAGTLAADLRGNGAAQTDLDGLPPLPFDDLDIFVNPVKGTLSLESAKYVDGKAAATFTAGSTCGAGSAQAKLDSETVSMTPITIACDHDLTATKSNNVSGDSVVGGAWTWTVTITNTGTDPVVFASGQKVLRDDLPSSGLSYGTVTKPSGVNCAAIVSGNLSCTASGTLTIPGNSSISIAVAVTANDAATYTNPRSAGVCSVDPDDVIQTENGSNNGCGPDQVVVDQADTTTSITSDSPDPSVPGGAVTVKYTVSGPGTETGNVTVSDGVDSCVASAGAGQCSISLTTLGSRTLTAKFDGDANHKESTSTGVPHTVSKLGTSVTIDADTPDPSLIGTAVDVEYTVTGADTPTGDVTISDGVDSCTGSVADGTCSITLSTAGARTLSAVYEGDDTHDGSTSADESHTVNKIATTTTITSDTPDPSALGASVTVQYTVTGAPGSANVTVSDGVNSCTGTVTAAQCAITLTTPGARTLTATYAGDATHDESSDTEAHTVNSAPTVTVVAGGSCNSSTTLATLRLPIADADGDTLTVTVTTSNATVATGALGGTPANRTLAVTAKKAGAATITVNANDGKGGITSLVVTARVGGNGSDVITGGTGTDVIFGINGADTLAGGDSPDYICSGNGTGTSSGGAGNDTIDGQNADDILRGDDGNDVLTGGKGIDRFIGGAGLDTFTDVAKGEITDGP